jgi:repressor LexA
MLSTLSTKEEMKNTAIGARLREIRLSKSGKGFWSVRSVADRAGISNAYLSQIETGQVKQPSPDTLKKLAESLRHDHLDLLRVAGYLPADPPDQKTIKIPVLGFTPAGDIKFVVDDVQDWLEINFDLVKDRNTFALRIKGDCLKNAGIFDGDLIIVSKTQEVRDGDIAVIRIDGECTCKKIFKHGDQLILQPMNADFQPIVIDLKSKPVEIIGKVIRAMKTFA